MQSQSVPTKSKTTSTTASFPGRSVLYGGDTSGNAKTPLFYTTLGLNVTNVCPGFSSWWWLKKYFPIKMMWFVQTIFCPC